MFYIQPKATKDCDVRHLTGKSMRETIDRMTAYFMTCGFTRATLFYNFTSNLGTLLPPSGYAAKFAKGALFCKDPFINIKMFFGACIFEVATPQWRTAIPPDTKLHIQSCANLFIRDVSPNPPGLDAHPRDGWVEVC